ncbi:MAG: sugar ABC transporter substrate-binding protein [Leptolyngbyaceae cyanobacterium SM1_3_5]|nr:sugar ABC transporter substrate-binding protein [Leptolyngbyaceae cyanobacterium SM1_3_5]
MSSICLHQWKPLRSRSLALLVLMTVASSACPVRAEVLSAQLPGLAPATPLFNAAYTLGAGDRIRIDIFQVPQYSGENTVLVNGSLNLPAVGAVDVSGLTLEQAAAAISAGYSRILRRPAVNLSLIAPRPVQVGVAGEVARPGSYTLDSQTNPPTLTQVLEAAGGIRQAADLRRVEVRRPQRSGGDQIIAADLMQLLQTGDLRNDMALRDGDTIFVPTATAIDLTESTQLADASFAAQEDAPINIAVVGAVFRPGPYSVTSSARTAEAGVPGSAQSTGQLPTVTRAIQLAGGITPLANIRQIQIRRLTRSGTEQVFQVDLWQLLKAGDLAQDAILQDRDTVIVPQVENIDAAEAAEVAAASFSPDTIRVNIVGEVIRPGVIEVPPNTPLNQGLLSAGGFNNRASRSSVELIRLNLNGSVSRSRVEIDFTQGVDEATNPSLRNDDVIVVGRSDTAEIGDTLETLTNPLSRFLTLIGIPFNLFDLF